MAAGAGDPARWLLLALSVLAQASLSAMVVGLAAITPAIKAGFDLTVVETTIVLSGASAGGLLSLTPLGHLADRRGGRLVTVISLVGMGVALVAAAFAPGYPALVALVTTAGAVGAGVNVGTGRAVVAAFGGHERGVALGIRHTAVPLGGAVAALLLPAIVAADGLRGGLLALAAAQLAVGAAMAVLVRDPPGSPRRADPVWEASGWAAASGRSTLARLSIASAGLSVAQVSIVAFLVLFLTGERQLSPGAAAVVLAAAQLLGAFGRVFAGHLSDRAHARLPLLRRIAVLMFASLTLATVLLEAPVALLVPAFALAGGLSQSWNGLSYTAAAELAGLRRSGAAIGVQQTVLATSNAVVPFAFAALLSVTSWAVAFGLAALAPLAGFAILGKLAEPRPP